MSLNGDILVIRNGRTASQVSVYNYPEHLNPFYEDDQHKRLRFWKINKRSGDGEVRRNSFSLAGLKDVWAFKSFRLKKKSSTLGINKTSESPPPLRRDLYVAADNNGSLYNYDQQSRYSTDGNFHRNALYRSSLQNVNATQNSPSGFGLRRNDQYRSTMGAVPRGQQQSPLMPQSRRSSQLSVTSTNPFDTDNEDDISIDRRSLSGTSPTKRTPRKKKAPAPPVPVHKVNSEATGTSPSTSLTKTAEEDQSIQNNPLRIEESLEIANLTAEIENFVKTTNDDSPDTRQERVSSSPKTKTNGEIPKPNGAIPKESTTASPASKETIVTSTSTTTIETTTKETTSAPSKESNKLENTESLQVEVKEQTSASPKKQNEVRIEQKPEVGQIECIHVHVGSPRTPSESSKQKLTSFQSPPSQESEKITGKTSFVLISPPTRRRQVHTVVDKENNVEDQKSITPIPPKAAATQSLNTDEKRFDTFSKPVRSELKITEEVESNSSPSVKPAIAPKPNVEPRIEKLPEIHKRTTVEEPVPRKRSLKKVSIETVEPVIISDVPKTKAEPAPQNIEVTTTTTITSLSKVTEKDINQKPSPVSGDSLKITESDEDLLERNGAQEPIMRQNGDILVHHNRRMSADEFDALHRIKQTSHLDWKKSSLAPLESNVPPEKRKSVKDIIESINRSQRLLNAAATRDQSLSIQNLPQSNDNNNGNRSTPLTQRKFSDSNNDLNQNQRTLDESQREVKRMFEEITVMENTGAACANGAEEESDLDQQKLDNSEIFKKCRVNKEVYDYRESSPTASNLDWNPLPKPKRTKNLSDL